MPSDRKKLVGGILVASIVGLAALYKVRAPPPPPPPPGALSIRNTSAVSVQPLTIDWAVEWVNTTTQPIQFIAQVRVGPSSQFGTITLNPGESTGILTGIHILATQGTYDIFFEALAVGTNVALIPPTIISVTVAGGPPPPPPPPGPQFGDIIISLFSATDAGALTINVTANYTNNRSDIPIPVDLVVDVLTLADVFVTGAQLPSLVLQPGAGITFAGNLPVPSSGTYKVRWSAFESAAGFSLATAQEVNLAL